LRETQGGFRGDKEAWFWNDEVQGVVRALAENTSSRRPDCLTLKRVAKAAVAKAAVGSGLLYEKLEGREGEKFVFRLAKSRNRATLDIRAVKSARSSGGAILRKPGEVRRRWKEYFDRLLNEEFAHKKSPQLEATLGPIKLDRGWGAQSNRKNGGWKSNWSRWDTCRGMKVARRAWGKVAHAILGYSDPQRRFPEAWRSSSIVPILKQREDAMECSDYKGIELIAHTMKVYEHLVDSRLIESRSHRSGSASCLKGLQRMPSP
uniref:Reverse transcriptase domain-containing protein n=1 Tax=Haemonchus placei TaxID=6290 RepID=A0A0N4WA05_HAEPC